MKPVSSMSFLSTTLFLVACSAASDPGTPGVGSVPGTSGGSTFVGQNPSAAGGAPNLGAGMTGTGGEAPSAGSTGGATGGGASVGSGGDSAGGTSSGGSSSGSGGASAGQGGNSPFGGSFADDDDPSVCTQVLQAGADAEAAVNAASPGDVICLRAGDYPRLIIENSGSEGAPITVRAYPGERQLPKIVASGGYSIRVNEEDYVHIEGLWLDGANNQGLYVYHSDYVVARFNKVTNVGQECMRFKFSNYGAFAYNHVETCGTKGPNGEGIYVGSGEEPDDDTHGATIVGNDVSDTHDEGIELKGSTHDVIVENNRVHDLTCRDGGAIVVTTADHGKDGVWETGHVIRGNVIWNVSTSSQYKDGNGINIRRGARVYNNVSYGNQHFGIRVDDKNDLNGKVWVHHNTFCDNLGGDVAILNDADVELANNIGSSDSGNLACSASFFTNVATGDYSLLPNTAAVDSTSDVGIDIDIEGNARPSGAGYDYGAYER